MPSGTAWDAWKANLAICLLMLLLQGTLAAGCGSGEAGHGLAVPFIDWAGLSNPVLADDDIPLKDPCVVHRAGTFHIFTSGASYRTRDFKRFQGPFEGYGSPDVTRLDETRYILVYQTPDLLHPGPSPGVAPDSPNNRYRRLFYRTSEDLVHWSEGADIFPDLPPDRNIDGALARLGNAYHLAFKTGVGLQGVYVARSAGPQIDGIWIGPLKAHAGRGCLLDKLFPVIGDNVTRWAENYQFLRIDGRWRMLATARHPDRPLSFGYMDSHEPFLYALEGPEETLEAWTNWVDKTWLRVPEEGWNTLMHANSAYLADWREYDGYFYLVYAGTDQETTDGRGHGRIGMVRSRDLVDWQLPGNLR